MRTGLAAMALLAMTSMIAGCGALPVGVAAPEALVAWSPRPDDRSARITALQSSGERTYVGFSDGEMFSRASVGAGWAAFNQGELGCAQRPPGGPITTLAITEEMVFATYAGTPGAPGIWHSPLDRPCWAHETVTDDLLSLSISPFSSVELLALGEKTRWVAHQLTGEWDASGALPSLGFDGDVRAMATASGPLGAPRGWLGDGSGHIYYSDDVATTSAPDHITWHPVTPDPGFPQRPVIAISVPAERTQSIWITFFGLGADGLWRSDDGGVSWRNPHGGDLPDAAAAAGADASAGAISRPAASFVGVSRIPDVGAAVVAALVPGPGGRMLVTSFWNAEGSDDWTRF